MFKASAKDNAWIYIQSYNDADGEYVAYLVTLEEDGEWAAEQITLSTIEDSEPGTSPLGTPDDVILESNDIEVEDSDTGDIVQVYFIVRVTGKEKQGELKEGKLKGVVGMATFIFPGIGECVGSVIISGKLKKEEKVPEEVIAAKDAA